ncbi:transcription factor mef2A-like [Tetranychus urticae]|uniref:transcription factor mef2A-like n=1 Tax=Tetranychus urticae TaxID=32264 RepID=UPI00077BAD4C|nr:transcription factor mef2A-like [Tetranychus urticae]XP_015794591.1 transcription factor mef2A-like [Tetranychus urticae]
MSKPGLGLPGRRRHSRISFLPRVSSEVVDYGGHSASSGHPASASSSNSSSSSNIRSVGSSSHGDKDKYRLVVMGASKVGKTAIIKRFLYDAFPADHNPTVEELHKSEYEIKGIGTVAVEILDTSGTFSFPAMRRLAINSGSAFILVYAINDKESFDEVTSLREMIAKTKGSSNGNSNESTASNNCPDSNGHNDNNSNINNNSNNNADDSNNRNNAFSQSTADQSSGETLIEPAQVPIVIAGNKIDLSESRIISKEMVEFECIDWEVGFVECSAKNNDNITSIFQQLLLQAHLKGSLKIIAGPSTHYHQHSHHHNPWSLLTSSNHHSSSNNGCHANHNNSPNGSHSTFSAFSTDPHLNDVKKSESNSRRRSSLPVTDLFNYSMSLGGLKNHRSSPRKKRKSCTPS